MELPSVVLSSVKFSDGTTVDFDRNDIIIFVGPNNAGKSVALKNIKEKSSKNVVGVVIKDAILRTIGTVDNLSNWLEANFRRRSDDPSNPQYFGFNASVNLHQAKHWWIHNQDGLQQLADFFIYLLTTEARLNAAHPAPSISLTQDPLSHPIHYMQVDDRIELKVSSYFRQAFGQDLVVHRNAGSQVPLYCGERPIPKEGQDRVSLDYIKSLEQLSTLHTQGDGMRSFVGVILHSLVVNHTVVLIDEPEAFLHPPQARLLGRMLVEEAPDNRQMFIATHSGDFLRGILDASSSRVRIIRLQREGDINNVAELNNAGIRKIWEDPLLRYSNVLDGLFHNKVIISESDSDSRFYAAMNDAVFDPAAGRARKDMMFLQCGGKARLPTVIQSLRDLKVPISAVADFDVLSSEQPLRAIYESLGGNWAEIISDWKLVKSAIEQKKPELNSEEVSKEINEELSKVSVDIFPKDAKERIQRILRRSSPWSIAKEIGKGFVPSGDATQACNRLFENLKARGLFVVEVGELEGFARSVGGHGPKWVNSVLTKNLAEDPELENARLFIRSVVG
jgi:predicted ATPase